MKQRESDFFLIGIAITALVVAFAWGSDGTPITLAQSPIPTWTPTSTPTPVLPTPTPTDTPILPTPTFTPTPVPPTPTPTNTPILPTPTFTPTPVPPTPTELWAVEYRWGDPPLGFRWDPFPLVFEGWMDVRVENRGVGDAFNVTAEIMSWPANPTVPDPNVTVGDIPAGGSAWSGDTFTTRVDMANPVDPCEEVFWRIEYDDAAGVHHVIENVPEFPPGEGPPPCP